MFNYKILNFFAGILSSFLFLIGLHGEAEVVKHYPHYLENQKVFNIAETENIENHINVMSFNIRCISSADKEKTNWYYRANLVIKNIEQAAPDIIGFQEVQKKQQSYLEKTLKGYEHIISYRDKSKRSEAVPIYYRADKYNLINKGSFWLSKTPEVESQDWGSSQLRICSYAVLEEKTSDKQLLVFNAHLDHVSEEARVNGISLIISKIQEFGDLPAILMGDFNAREGSQTYTNTSEHFFDTKYQTENTMNEGTFHNWGKISDPARIDFIFVSKGDFLVEEYFVQTNTYDGAYPSDHFPVGAKLVLK